MRIYDGPRIQDENDERGKDEYHYVNSETLEERAFRLADSPDIVEHFLHAKHHPDDEPDEHEGAYKSEYVVCSRNDDLVRRIHKSADEFLAHIQGKKHRLQLVSQSETSCDGKCDCDERHEGHRTEITQGHGLEADRSFGKGVQSQEQDFDITKQMGLSLA